MKLFCKKCSNIFSVDPGSSVTVQCPRCKTDISCPEEELGVGSVIGGFVIEQRLNAGGMGIVFAARQISLDRPVALKVLMKEFTDDSEYVDSLFREARAAAQINHPNIVQAYDVGKDGGTAVSLNIPLRLRKAVCLTALPTRIRSNCSGINPHFRWTKHTMPLLPRLRNPACTPNRTPAFPDAHPRNPVWLPRCTPP